MTSNPSMRASRDPMRSFKILSAVCIIVIYILYNFIHKLEATESRRARRARLAEYAVAPIQLQSWADGEGSADEKKVEVVIKAAKRTFSNYREQAWGYDDIKPVSGTPGTSKSGWGVFIVDSCTTLALMGLWDELSLEVDFIVQELDFGGAEGLVDPFETTIRYLGGLVSLVDLIDSKIVPETVVSKEQRDKILDKAITLGGVLAPAYDTRTGMLWPRVDAANEKGVSWHGEDSSESPAVSLARTGSNFLENRVLTRLSGDDIYFKNASRAWSGLVWNKYAERAPGLVDGPRNILTGEPVKHELGWDAGHDSYYEYLLKAVALTPYDPYAKKYTARWLEAAGAVRHNLSSKSSPEEGHAMQHIFIGKYDNKWFLNEMSHLACFAPGNLILGGSLLQRKGLITLGKALLEGCRHAYTSTTTGIGPETFSWMPGTGQQEGTFGPQTRRQEQELRQHGIWVANPEYKLRPEYAESLFYAWRITGEQRYRDWAWEAFEAIEQHCRAKYGYGSIADVTAKAREGDNNGVELLDESESFWMAETLKYFYLIFADVNVGSLDTWVYTTEGHPLRRTLPG